MNFLISPGGEDERSCECPAQGFKCNTGPCIPNYHICDGEPQCADSSDDWDCFNLSTYRNESITSNDPTSDKQSPSADNMLQIKQENGEYAFVCSDNWSERHADLICKRFGYSHSRHYSFVEIGEQHSALVRINNDFPPNETIFANLHATNACDSNAIVQLVCEQYGKRICILFLNF